jgi:3-methylfumaryl-CoA hydratase
MIDDLKAWIGKRQSREERIDPARANALLASLERPSDLKDGGVLPPLFHWLHFWEARPPSGTGPDGHPTRGGFLPPVAQPRRMWAGGRVEFLRPLRLGETARKTSQVADVTEKVGQSGPLIFVTVNHEVSTVDGVAVRERQDLVFRDAPTNAATPAPPPKSGDSGFAQWRETVQTGPVLLFRYSALTMNSHRIHYDAPYAMDVEGYDGLVVHGPLQATLMMALAARELVDIVRFDYRGLSPATDRAPIDVCGRPDDGGAELWVEQGGRRTMSGRAVLKGAA